MDIDIPVKKEVLDRYKDQAKDSWRFEQMVRMFGVADSRDEMGMIAVTFFMTDLSYARADICLAMKVVEIDRGWR